MKRTLSILSVSIAVILGAVSAQAQALDGSSAYANARWVHDSDQGPNQNFNREWDGKKYDDAEIDVGAHTGLQQALIDFDLKDLRSTEESGALSPEDWGVPISRPDGLSRKVTRNEIPR